MSLHSERKVSETATELVRLMGVVDTNVAGTIHGGTVMRFVDETAALSAIRFCGMQVVTAGVDRMTFLQPVRLGELLRCRASVNAAWRTSIEVGVKVESENPITGEIKHTSTAYVTMVALGEDGRPVEVPELIVETDAERRRRDAAETRRANRLAERTQLKDARPDPDQA